VIGARIIYPVYERYLQRQCTHIPRHIAIIQDGNRRYARSAGISPDEGHRIGSEKTSQVLEWAMELGISHVTLYSFSTENFSRDSEEVTALFDLFARRFREIPTDEKVHQYHIRVRMLGDRTLLPPKLAEVISKAEEATKDYTDRCVTVAIAYGGRNEIIQAARRILAEVQDGKRLPDDVDPGTIEHHLQEGTSLPPVDLIIRSGHEYRTSNFLPWHANGHESAVYFCAPYWPLFRKIELLRAIRVYSQRIDTGRV
jgi:tritrans,polycis-undecaprenyl-diphosphate synthase [geranylgeranyl-diphosphate specific]